jgi:P-type E1-E2 ATPase
VQTSGLNKIEIVKGYQSKAQVIGMIGDGVNEAPALVEAGTYIAIEALQTSTRPNKWYLPASAHKAVVH